MDEERQIEAGLDAMLSGIAAPPTLAPAVLRRVSEPRMSRLPEILDSIGWIAVLAIVALAVLPLVPWVDPAAAFWGLALGVTSPILWYGWRSLRALNG